VENFFLQFLGDYPFFAPAIFVSLRALAIIIPPIPGGVMDIAGLLFFGWLKGLILAEVGIMLGAAISFWIARYFREPAVKRFASLGKIGEWERNLSETKKFWVWVLIRLPTNSLFDYISYAAGLTGISFWKFFFASMIGNLPGLFIFYYFGGLVYQSGFMIFLGFIASLLLISAIISRRDELMNRITNFFKEK
jgi:uncharacterized membrane protein YdjX (TVP38/TMEM64 family)